MLEIGGGRFGRESRRLGSQRTTEKLPTADRITSRPPLLLSDPPDDVQWPRGQGRIQLKGTHGRQIYNLD